MSLGAADDNKGVFIKKAKCTSLEEVEANMQQSNQRRVREQTERGPLSQWTGAVGIPSPAQLQGSAR